MGNFLVPLPAAPPQERSLAPGSEEEALGSGDEGEQGRDATLTSLASTDSGSSRETVATEAERVVMYRHILNSIVESEAIYLECLSVSLQYMKAMKVGSQHSGQGLSKVTLRLRIT